MTDLPETDTPVNLRPDLSEFGIEEVDRGICLDTGENRRTLRANKMVWITMYDAHGAPLNTLEVRSREMMEHAGIEALKHARPILSKPNDRNSDYLTGEDLIYEPEARELVPNWVLASTRTWLKKEAEREGGHVSKRPTTYIEPPGRCKVIKSDGVRCRMWHGGRTGDNGMCRLHVGSLLNTATGAIEKARTRVQNIAPDMIDVLEDLAFNATSEPVRMQSANSLLDRAGVRGGVEIEHKGEVEVRPAADIISERLKRLVAGADTAKEMEPSRDGSEDTETVPATPPGPMTPIAAVITASAPTGKIEVPPAEDVEDAILVEEDGSDDNDF